MIPTKTPLFNTVGPFADEGEAESTAAIVKGLMTLCLHQIHYCNRKNKHRGQDYSKEA